MQGVVEFLITALLQIYYRIFQWFFKSTKIMAMNLLPRF